MYTVFLISKHDSAATCVRYLIFLQVGISVTFLFQVKPFTMKIHFFVSVLIRPDRIEIPHPHPPIRTPPTSLIKLM